MSVSTVGELSKLSLSYSKDINYLNVDDGLAAHVFYTRSISDTSVQARTLDADDKTTISNVLKYYVTEIEASSAEMSIPTMVGKFTSQFPSMSDISFENVVKSSSNKYYYGYFTFSMTFNGIKRYYNVWCSDGVFQSTYPITDYTIVPMFNELSKFWQSPTKTISDIENSDPYVHIENVQTAIGDYPPTGVVWLEYNYVDPTNVSITIPVKWAIVHYGGSVSTDSLKAALVSYLTTRDTHTAAQWKTIFPDIFSSTKFVFYPLWSDYAIANMQVGQTGIFKNNFNIARLLSKGLTYFSDYSSASVNANLHYMPMPYKSIGLISMPGEDNPASRMSIDSVFADIINITSVHADYNRMAPKTQGFLNLLSECLTVGETMSITTVLPAKLYRVKRLSKTFIAFTYSGVEYLVAPKNAVPS